MQNDEIDTSILHNGLRAAFDKVAGEPVQDGSEKFRDELAHYTGEFLKTIPLFMPSVDKRVALISYAASAVLNGLDQVKAGDSFGQQLEDFGLGMTKGLAVKGSFDALGTLDFAKVNSLVDANLAPAFLAGKPLELSAKAFSFGISSRSIDTLLNRDSYTDNDGKFSLAAGVYNTLASAINPTSLATDLVVFSGSAFAFKGANTLLSGVFDRSPLAQNIGTGASFGFVSGAVGELQRQNSSEQHYDFGEIAWRGLLQGAVSAAAAAPGGFHINQLAAQRQMAEIPAYNVTLAPTESRARFDLATWGPSLKLSTEAVSSTAGANTVYAAVAETSFAAETRASSAAEPKAISAAEPKAISAAEAAADGDNESSTVPRKAKAARLNKAERSMDATKPGVAAPFSESNAAKLLSASPAKLIDEYKSENDAILQGAKKYQLNDGREFWQLQDGRILEEAKSGEATGFNIWSPFGTKEPSGTLEVPHDGKASTLWTYDERMGVGTDVNGSRMLTGRGLRLDESIVDAHAPEVVAKLTMGAAQFEEDWQAALRILHTKEGAPYQHIELNLNTRDIAGKSLKEIADSNIFAPTVIPARLYRIMSAEQASRLDDQTLQLKEGKISDQQYQDYRSALEKQAQPITVSETFAQKLDALRELRATAALSPRLLPEQAEAINESRRLLFSSPLKDVMLPEQLGQFFDRLPNRSDIQNFILLHNHSLIYRTEGARADALISGERTIRFYNSNNDVTEEFQHVLRHEWSHLLQTKEAAIGNAFTRATQLENYSGRQYGDTNEYENWAVSLGDSFLDPNADYFLTLAKKSPLKTVLLAEALKRTLKDAPEGENLQGRAELMRRIEYVDKEIFPKARAALSGAFDRASSDSVLKASDVIKELLQGDAGNQDLARRLVDTKYLLTTVDIKPENGNFTRDFSTRVLLRLDLLRDIDAAAFKAREVQYNTSLKQVSAYNTVALLTPGSPESNDVLALATKLSESKAPRAKLFEDIFPPAIMETAANNTTNPEAAVRAYKALSSSLNDTLNGFNLNLRIAGGESPAKQLATDYILGRVNPYYISYAVTNLARQIPNASTEFAQSIKRNAKTFIDLALSNPNDVVKGFSGLLQANLSERLFKAKPEFNDESITASIGQLKAAFPERLNTILQGKDNHAKEQALQKYQEMEAGGDKDLIALAKSIISADTLTKLVKDSDGAVALQAMRGLYDYYPTEAMPVMLEAVKTNPSLRTEALTKLFTSNSTAQLKETNDLVNTFNSSIGPRDRVSLVTSLTSFIPSDPTKLDQNFVDRTELRIAMANKLAEPLPLALYQDPLNKLEDAIKKFRNAQRAL